MLFYAVYNYIEGNDMGNGYNIAVAGTGILYTGQPRVAIVKLELFIQCCH